MIRFEDIINPLLNADKTLALILLTGLGFFIILYIMYLISNEKYPGLKNIKKSHIMTLIIILVTVFVLPSIAFKDDNLYYQSGFLSGVVNPSIFLINFLGGIFETAILFGVALLVLSYLLNNRKITSSTYANYAKIFVLIILALALFYGMVLLEQKNYSYVMYYVTSITFLFLLFYFIKKWVFD